MKIDSKLLGIKAHYFLFNAGTGPIIPYITTLAKSLGFSTTVVGIIYTFLPIMGMIAKPTMGAIADKFHCLKAIFVASLVVCLISLGSIVWLPSAPAESTLEVHCDLETDVKIQSDKFDESFVKNLISSASSNGTIACDMTCLASRNILESAICPIWNQTQFCATVKSFPRFALSDTPPHFVTSDSPQYINFTGYLFPNKTQMLGSAAYIRMVSAEFKSNSHITPYCSTLMEMPCTFKCPSSPLITQAFLGSTIPDSEVPHLYQFWLFTAVLTIGWVAQAIVVSTSDTICFEQLGDRPELYGYQRLWGSVGWGIFSAVTGVLMDYFAKDSTEKNYIPCFVLTVFFLGLNVIVGFRMQCSQSIRSINILRDVGKLLSDLRIIVFLLWCISIGMGTAIIWNFLLWYLEDLAADYSSNATSWVKTLEGIAMAIQCLGGELPFFFLSERILKKLGRINSMTLVAFCFGVRFLLYSLLVNPWWCLPIEVMNGLTFGLFYAAMTSHASVVALPGTETTTQGLVGAIYEGVGVSLGSFIGGIFFDAYGGRRTMQIFGAGLLIVSFLHALVQFIVSRMYPLPHARDTDFYHQGYSIPRDAIGVNDDYTSALPS